jgi:putative ABC transport system ATP-binding protein
MSANGVAAIQAQGLSKVVQDATGSLTILDDISLTIRAGETAAIVGASGSGKSTLLGLLAGLDVPSKGSVKIFGEDLFERDEDGRAQLRAEKVGFVFQSFQLLPHLTALENVLLPLELSGRVPDDASPQDAARALLTRVGLGERLSHYPRTLSGGEQQRVALGARLCQPAAAASGGRTDRQSRRQDWRGRDRPDVRAEQGTGVDARARDA